MRGLSIERVLVDFDAPDMHASSLRNSDISTGLFVNSPFAAPEEIVVEGPSVSEQIEAEYQRGLAEGHTAALASVVMQLQSQRQQFDAERTHARESWTAEFGEIFARQLREGLEAGLQQIGDIVADVLKPFVLDSARQRAVEELVVKIREIGRDRHALKFDISGPADLLDAIKAQFQETTFDIGWAPDNQSDVRVVMDQTILQTDLAQWVETLGSSGNE